MKKRMLALLLAGMMLLSATACDSREQPEVEEPEAPVEEAPAETPAAEVVEEVAEEVAKETPAEAPAEADDSLVVKSTSRGKRGGRRARSSKKDK